MSRARLSWRWVLSHHSAEELHRCYRLPLTARGLHVCARCLGLYPVLVATIGFEAGVWRFESSWRWLAAFALVTPAVIDWSRSMLFGTEGRNLWRTGTGALAGLGLGLAFGDYFRDPGCTYFWTLMGLLAALTGLVWWVRPSHEPQP